ncbi:Tigger transposable element-derived protein 1-like 155 [Homarus americanus]|uniref:Tigger transposable element-derived protein 1-like 155 n=1 Tax=Homarus americanus TaxID=6706 RepID=A0A8J5JHK9_HOMAM|nr:Tigger transposable element-derived protein 1-like 155 [Homarus americanus]
MVVVECGCDGGISVVVLVECGCDGGMSVVVECGGGGGGQTPSVRAIVRHTAPHQVWREVDEDVILSPPEYNEQAWKEVTVRCLCAAWRPLWPECVLQRDFEGFEESEEEAVVHEIVALGNSMGLEVDDDDVEELVEEHSKELSTEELLELHKEENETLKRSLTSEESGEEEDKEESRIIPAKDLKDAFFCWSKLSKLAEDYHPDVGSVQKAISVFNDNVMNYFWKIFDQSFPAQ